MARLRGFLWLIAGVVVAVLAGGVAFIALSRATTEQTLTAELLTPQQSVVVASRHVDVHGVMTKANLEIREVSVDTVPEGAAKDIDTVLGRITLVELYPGEVILAQRLLDPNVVAPNGRLALVMADDEVLLALPAGDLLSQVDVLKPGDHVDFFFSYELPIDRDTGFLPVIRGDNLVGGGAGEEEEETEIFTFDLMQNVSIAALVRSVNEDGEEVGAPRALLLAINPQDALVLKYMKDVGANIDLVLRAPGAEGEFKVEPVDLDYIINGYITPQEGLP